MIGEVRSRHPEIIFLAEGFTRPKVMKRLAKVGFNQSRFQPELFLLHSAHRSRTTSLAFYKAGNDNIIYYGKRTADLSDFLLFHVCLDPHSAQGADFEVPLWEFGLPDGASIEVEDMVTGRHFT